MCVCMHIEYLFVCIYMCMFESNLIKFGSIFPSFELCTFGSMKFAVWIFLVCVQNADAVFSVCVKKWLALFISAEVCPDVLDQNVPLPESVLCTSC